MTIHDVIINVSGLIVAVGGGGGIVVAFSNYFGKILAKRYEEKIKAGFQNEINAYQSQLDILKQITLRYSDKQFDQYSLIWASLYELKLRADDLWEQATLLKLERFSKQLKSTKIEIEKVSLFIEEAHYKELVNIIRHFSEYQIGKSDLINFRQTNNISVYEVEQIITDNGLRKNAYEILVSEIKEDFKKQIRGE